MSGTLRFSPVYLLPQIECKLTKTGVWASSVRGCLPGGTKHGPAVVGPQQHAVIRAEWNGDGP